MRLNVEGQTKEKVDERFNELRTKIIGLGGKPKA
jgi:hypothetical protein